jgi:hypothetical protein
MRRPALPRQPSAATTTSAILTSHPQHFRTVSGLLRCLAPEGGGAFLTYRGSKSFIESKVSRPVGSGWNPGQGFCTRPIYVNFEFAVAVYPVGGTSRHRLPPNGDAPAARKIAVLGRCGGG